MKNTDISSEASVKPAGRDDALADAQLQKLQLEIRQLRKPRWLDPVLQMLPAVTVLVSVFAFVFTGYQYVATQKKARVADQLQQRLKLEEQARADLQQIVQFPADEKRTPTEVEFLLIDLERLQQLLESQRKSDDELPDYASQKEPTTIILANLIRSIHFNEPRNVDLADTVLRDWEDYQKYLKENQGYVQTILANQEDALTELRRKAPKYFTNLRMDEATKQYIEPKSSAETRTRFRIFEKLVDSFGTHLELLNDESYKDDSIKLFQAAICNPQLTKATFGKNFKPQQDLITFEECLK